MNTKNSFSFSVRFLALCSLPLACARGADAMADHSLHTMDHATADPKNAKTGHALRGVVTQILADKKLVMIKHEDIPGYMMAMTMPFRVSAEIFPVLRPGLALVGTIPADNSGELQLKDVRLLASEGQTLATGVPYRLALGQKSPAEFAGSAKFSVPSAGTWRVCVGEDDAWVELNAAGGKSIAAQTCDHADPTGFPKALQYPLEAGPQYTVQIGKAPEKEIDLLILK
jgi:Cu/Ag efflux protein CusF